MRDTDIVDNDDDSDDGEVRVGSDARLLPYQPMVLPKPPAGFVVDDHGRVVMASAPAKRIASIVSFLLVRISICLLLFAKFEF